MYVKIENTNIEDFRKKKIILFGASSTGVKALEEFQNIQADIIGFCDNNKEKEGKCLEGYLIFGPEHLKQLTDKDETICIMITSTYEKEIEKQLKEMHIRNVYVVHMGVLHDIIGKGEFSNNILPKEKANEKIYNMLNSKKAFFIGRVGSTELETICNYCYFTERISGKCTPYTNNITNMLSDWCGFYPKQHTLMDEFCKLYLEDIKTADLLWSMWLSKYEDILYRQYCPNTDISLYEETAFPLYEEEPWTYALKGKKVLVIHPFDESIKRNYKFKEKLFQNEKFLPDFELITLKAVQSLADNKNLEYPTWFDALEYMKMKIDDIDFDVALIGAGAYGFPLGAYIKRIGKQALHIGGKLQLYFGIRGKYYDKFNYHNEYWTRPLESERPEGYKKVEAGRYW